MVLTLDPRAVRPPYAPGTILHGRASYRPSSPQDPLGFVRDAAGHDRPRPPARPAASPPTPPHSSLRPGALLHRVRLPAAAVWSLAPGRYLAIPDGDGVVVLPLGRLTRIGRRPASDIVLDDATVSRRHALVLERDGEPVIADDRSRNGVFVNGRRVSESRLHHGDEVRIGDGGSCASWRCERSTSRRASCRPRGRLQSATGSRSSTTRSARSPGASRPRRARRKPATPARR